MRMPRYGLLIIVDVYKEEAGQHFLFDLLRGSW
jgi:hypothetical protein